jgi:glycosyltransferase involved in cell wall biosynthesis
MSVFEPSISVIIPVYNHWEHVRTCIVSLQVQTYRPAQILVIDDGSTQALPEGLQHFFSGALVEYVRVPHAGAPHARNVGLQKATGDFVFFCDADVVVRPDLFSRLIEPLISDESRSFSYCDFFFGSHLMRGRVFNHAALKKRNFISSMALVRRKDAILWDEALTKFQDWDYWLSLSEKRKTGYYVPGALFRIVPREKGGMSVWVPRWGYVWPFCLAPKFRSAVLSYTEAKKKIRKKHG